MKASTKFAMAAVLTAAFTSVTAAHAFRRIPGNTCNTEFGTPGVYGITEFFSAAGARADLVCPMMEDNGFPNTSVTAVNFHGHNNGGGTAFAEFCAQPWFQAPGLSCSGFLSSTAADYTLSFTGSIVPAILGSAHAGWVMGAYVILTGGNSSLRLIFEG